MCIWDGGGGTTTVNHHHNIEIKENQKPWNYVQGRRKSEEKTRRNEGVREGRAAPLGTGARWVNKEKNKENEGTKQKGGQSHSPGN